MELKSGQLYLGIRDKYLKTAYPCVMELEEVRKFDVIVNTWTPTGSVSKRYPMSIRLFYNWIVFNYAIPISKNKKDFLVCLWSSK